MKIINKIVFLVFLSGVALSYQDLDIDGVDDSIDKCPNTPFDELVDEDGCSKTQKTSFSQSYLNNLTLKIGIDYYMDKIYENDKILNLYANYQFKNWDFSISNTNSTFNDSYNSNDIYFFLGHNFEWNKNHIKLSIGIKKNDNKEKNKKYNLKKNTIHKNKKKSNKNDYLFAIDYNYMINNKLNSLLYYEYTINRHKSKNQKNFSSFSIGIGYLFTQNLYSTLSYNQINSMYKDINKPNKNIELSNSYDITKKLFITAGYSYALDDLSYDSCFSLAFGINF